MGIIECATHGLVTPYQVLQDKEEGAELASAVVTVLLMPNGPLILSPSVLAPIANELKTEKKVEDEELVKLLALPIRQKKSKK